MSLILSGTDGLSDVDGSAATPAIRGTDANTGIFFGTDIIGFSEGGVEAMRIDSSGSVGIGTTTLTNKFNVAGAIQSTSTLVAIDANSVAMSQETGFSRIAAFGTDSATPGVLDLMVISTNGGVQKGMRIDSSGNVIVNATAQVAQGKFGVAFVGSTNQAASFNETSGASSWTTVLFQRTGTTIGSISNATSSTAYNTSSDYRLKENIAPMTGALAKVAQLKPVTYKWKVDGTDGQGFIAHELAEIVPDCVSGEKDATLQEKYEITPAVIDEEGNITTPAVIGTRTAPAYQGVDTSFLVATLTAAIQELKALNDTQAETLAQQSATITTLTTRIVALESAT